MKSLSLTILSFSLAALLIGCSQESDGTALIPEIESIMIEGTDKVHAIPISNEDLQLVGMITYSDSTPPQTATHELDWESNDTKIIDVVNGLLVPIANSGTVAITAKYRDRIFSNSHTVSIIPITDVNITSTNLTIDYTTDNNRTDAKTSSSYQVAANGVYTDMNQTLNISSHIIWTSSNLTIASIGPTGSITTLGEGNSTIKVSVFGDINSTIELNVTRP